MYGINLKYISLILLPMTLQAQTWSKLSNVTAGPPYSRAWNKPVFFKGLPLIPMADPNCCFGLASNALFQYPWNRLWTSGTIGITSTDSFNTPSDRQYYHQIAYDNKRDLVWMFGVGDFYKFDGQTWTQVCGNVTTPCPSYLGMVESTLVYDSTNDVLIIYGGLVSGKPVQVTIIFNPNDNTFTKVCDNDCNIPALDAPGFTYMSNGKSLLFGGFDGTNLSNSTYLFDTLTRKWNFISSPLSPPAQKFPAMDYVNGKVVLIGREQPSTHVWSFDTQWTDIYQGGPSIPAAQNSCAVYNPKTNSMIVFTYFSGVYNLQLPVVPPIVNASLVIANVMNPIYSIIFSSFPVGQGARQPVLLIGSGNPLIIDSISVVGDPDFSVDFNCALQVPISAPCTVNIIFNAKATGLRNSTLQISSNAVDSPKLIQLSGTVQ